MKTKFIVLTSLLFSLSIFSAELSRQDQNLADIIINSAKIGDVCIVEIKSHKLQTNPRVAYTCDRNTELKVIRGNLRKSSVKEEQIKLILIEDLTKAGFELLSHSIATADKNADHGIYKTKAELVFKKN